MPPSTAALPESAMPNFLPMASPAMLIANVTAEMINAHTKAIINPYDAIVKPTDKASMEVAIPCTRRAKNPQPGICRLFPVIFDAVTKHLASDKQEQSECNPWYALGEYCKVLYQRMDKYPADHRHDCLKNGEYSCNTAHFFAFHIRLMQAVCQRNRKSIHGKPDAQKHTVYKK